VEDEMVRVVFDWVTVYSEKGMDERSIVPPTVVGGAGSSAKVTGDARLEKEDGRRTPGGDGDEGFEELTILGGIVGARRRGVSSSDVSS
jgi:hypothetical protein